MKEKSDEHGWREYEALARLFEGYLSILITATSAYFAVSAAVVSLVLTGAGSDEVRWALLVPIVMAGTLTLGMGVSLPAAVELRDRLDALRTRLDIGLVPHGHLLVRGLGGLALLCGASGVFMVILLGELPLG